MLNRIFGAGLGALLAGSALVACSSTEPTSPRLQHSLRSSFDASSSCSSDTQAPTITYFSATPNVLSAADRQLVPVTLNWGAVDNCGAPVCAVSSVVSNEKGKKTGQPADVVMTPGSTVLNLRAEKGNAYTITLRCADAAGNATTATTVVTVLRETSKCTKDDQGKGDDKNGGDVDLENKCKKEASNG